ncbi:arabinose-5-phosphate isomerase [Nitrospira sp.]|nr:arabinose-5-phosphate isomerase [Nitrospira sp.]
MSLDRGKRVLEIEARAISALVDRLDARFDRAVSILMVCQGKVVVTGMGKSGLVGQKIAATLASTGTPAFFLHPADAIHGDLGMVTRGDVVLAISNSGETEEVVKLLPIIKRLNISVVALTGKVHSTLAKHSDTVLDVSVEEEACPLGLAPTASTTATLAMGDALAIALLERRGFKEEDFALVHPGGALGRRLLLKVCDVMHHGEAVPQVKASAPARDAILQMTGKKLGMTTVVDGAGRLVGVVTDGDLRRALEKGVDLRKAKAGDLGTRSPKTITPDELATAALELMERFSITSLVVVEGKRSIAGVIHLHDLLKSGVA